MRLQRLAWRAILCVLVGLILSIASRDAAAQDGYYGAGAAPQGDGTQFASLGDFAETAVAGAEGDCNCACDDSCKGLLLGFIRPTSTDFCSFISPMTNPVFFEDPRTLSEVRIIFVNHVIPNRAPLGGGDVQLLAAQMRAAITDRLSIIATKDGFFFTGADPLIMDDGWADVAAGLKYNLISDPDSQTIVSGGFTFELPVGTPRALQGNGSGEFNLFLPGGTQIGSAGHWVSAGGLRLPTDSVDESQVSYWSNHLDWQLAGTRIYALAEANWYHWIKSGGGGVPGLEGLDVINLGSTGVAGNNIVTGAIGLKFKPTVLNEIGVAWEVPLTDRRDILDNRLTVDCILRW